MAEYIEREALQQAVAGIHFDAVFAIDFGKTFFHKVLNQYRDAVLETIKRSPAADVVEVVRCKDCRYCDKYYPAKEIGKEAMPAYKCLLDKQKRKAENFCSEGRKKDGDGAI